MKREIKIEGMSCAHCVKRVSDALQKVEGVTNVEVDLENKTALVESDNVSSDVLTNVIEELGYDVKEVNEL